MTPARMPRTAALVGIVLSTVGCDQATKHIARTHLSGALPRAVLGGFVHLALTQNDGGFLSIGATLPAPLRTTVFLAGVSGCLLIAAAYLVRVSTLRFSILLCAWCLWAGGLSNLLDRVRFAGRVTDFMIVGCGPLHTGVFNVADVAITAGAVLLTIMACRASLERAPRTESR